MAFSDHRKREALALRRLGSGTGLGLAQREVLMIDECDDEVEVLREHTGWTVVCGGIRLERFDGKDEFRALARACEWGSKYAEARGIAAWFLQEGRRTPMNPAAIWKPKR